MNTRQIIILPIIGLLLLIPLIAMQFSTEVNWGVFDFFIAGILLSSLGLSIEYILRKIKDTKQRIIFFSVVILVFFAIWAELAVGIFGTPLAGS